MYGKIHKVRSKAGKMPFAVEYAAHDEDTPMVTVVDSKGWKHVMTDVEAEELARQLQWALARLPSSK